MQGVTEMSTEISFFANSSSQWDDKYVAATFEMEPLKCGDNIFFLLARTEEVVTNSIYTQFHTTL